MTSTSADFLQRRNPDEEISKNCGGYFGHSLTICVNGSQAKPTKNGSLSNGVVLIKSNGRKCFGISFLALLNDFTDVLLNQDTHPEMTKNPKSKGNSLGLFANTFSAFGNPFELVDRFSLAASLSEFVGY